MLLPDRYVLTTVENFQKWYCIKFYLHGHQYYLKSKSKIINNTYVSTDRSNENGTLTNKPY